MFKFKKENILVYLFYALLAGVSIGMVSGLLPSPAIQRFFFYILLFLLQISFTASIVPLLTEK